MVPGVDDEVLDLFGGQTPIHRTVVDDHIDIREFGQGLDTGHLRGVLGVCGVEIGVEGGVGYTAGGCGTGVELLQAKLL